MPTSERTPLLWQSSNSYQDHPPTPANNEQPTQHAQFLMMTGTPSSAPTPNGKRSAVPRKSLYGRASRQLSAQRLTYYGTASLSNAMLLGQVMIGAALTALGASQSSHILITVFGAMNTIIAGLVAYLKSRGQPMRARMYRDDLERVVDEIENSEVMWLGISNGVHGYEDIDTGSTKDGKAAERNPNAVTVRSEVARLTRLYDRAVRNNTVNNPDMYMTGAVDGNYGGAALRNRGGGGTAPVAVAPTVAAPVVSVTPGQPAVVGPVAAPAVVHDPDESPATAPPVPKPKEEKKAEELKPEAKDAEASKPEVEKEDDAKGKGKVEGDGSDMDTPSKPPITADKPDEGATPAPSPTPTPAPDAVGPSGIVKQEPVHDPDAEPASDSNVPLKKVAGDSMDGES